MRGQSKLLGADPLTCRVASNTMNPCAFAPTGLPSCAYVLFASQCGPRVKCFAPVRADAGAVNATNARSATSATRLVSRPRIVLLLVVVV